MIPELFTRMSSLYLLHHRLYLRRLRHIALNQQRLVEVLRHVRRIGFVLSLRIGNVIHDALCSMRAKSLDHLCADPPRAAGDQHNFARKIERVAHDDYSIR